MKVLSLFDGMSCGQIALKELGIIPDVYYASEIDKHAIYQTQLNFPNTIQLGSVTNVDVSKLEPIDLLIGGSPCQSFSFAGKRKGMATKCEIEITKLEQYLELKEQGFEFEGQSYLFWEYMRILTDIRKYNPDIIFLLENVEMGSKWERVLSEAIGVFGVHINSALVSAQNRKRIYWTNIRIRQQGLFGELHSDIPQPDDKGILLRDILEENVEEKYFLSEKMIKTLTTDKDLGNGVWKGIECKSRNEKSSTLTSRLHKMGKADTYIKLDKQLKQKFDQQKASCFTAGGNSGGNHSDMDLICVAMRGRNHDNPSDRTTGSNTKQRLEPNKEGKTNCITSVQKDNLIFGCDFRSDEGIRIKSDGKSGTLRARARNDESCGQMVITSLNNRINSNYKSEEEKANAFLSTSYKGSQANGMTLINSINKHNEKRENKRRSCEILLALREEINSKKNVEREMEVYARFFKDEVLFKRMYEKFISESEVRAENYKEWEKPSSKNVTNCNVLNMQFENWYRCSSQRQKSIKQFIRQLAACMSELSQQNTSSKESMHYLWQTTKGVWVLRKALSEIQKIWDPICSETKPVRKSSRIRRLTPTEASRLQTVPSWYIWECSETQQYKLLGNGWTIEVIKHIFKWML